MKNNHKIIKTIIIILIILICIILGSYFIIIKKLNKLNKDTSWSSDTTPVVLKQDIEEVTIRDWYYIMKNISEKYYEYIKNYNADSYYSKFEGNVTITEEDKQAIYKNIYDMLDTDYIKSNGISESDIKKILNEYKDSDDFIVNKIYSQDINDTTTEFWVDISLLKNHKKIGKDEVIVGKLDRKNGLFGIIPVQISNKQIMQNNVNISTNEIEKNLYNQYEYEKIDDEQVVKDFLAKYRDAALYNREDAYNMLDEEYKEKRFQNYTEFSEYLDKNIKKIATLTFKKYIVNNESDYKEYICQDTDDNIYIFHEKAVMNYSIILDTYTMLLKQFTQKYDKADDNQKVAMNIEKIVQALNWKDTKYIYDKLDNTFRENKFSTLNDFDKYINNDFVSTYDLEYSTYSNENGIYVQNIILKDKKTQESKNVTIIMKLKENYEFVMSFS